MRLYPVITLSLLLAACGNEPSPQAPVAPLVPAPDLPPPGAPVPPPPTATAKATPPSAVMIHVSTLVVPLGEGRDDVDVAPITASLHDLDAAVKTCIDGAKVGDKSDEGNAWLVARIETSGALTGTQVASSELSGGATTCIQSALQKLSFPAPKAPLAISVVALVEGPVARGWPNAPDAKEVDAGEPLTATGTLFGGAVGSTFGQGGLGLNGVGEGGGGRGEGIGLGSIGTLGHGSGQGFGHGVGNGNGRLAGSHRQKPPSLRMGATRVSGRLPPEVIQRIVRQNFGRFRLCYENGLATHPALEGRVDVHFVIARDGSVTSAENAKSSTLADKSVVGCIVKSFKALSYPEPEGGTVDVVYPLLLKPGDSPSAPAKPSMPPPPKPLKVGGKTLDAMTSADIVHILADANATDPTTAVVTLDDKPHAPYVVFTRYIGDVLAVERVKAPTKSGAPAQPSSSLAVFERADSRYAIRVIGESPQLAGELMDRLVD